ncbi:MAG: alkaline phosphatase family protein [Solirubrobacteraceae bacterium]
MKDFVGGLKREALRGIAHLLPASWKEVVDVVAAPIPPTSPEMAPAPADPAAQRLKAIDHVVVVMLENRSFDHMLGYLSLPASMGGGGRTDIDGLRGPDVNFNVHDGARFPIHHLDQTKFKDETEDPDHSRSSVDQQLAGGGAGFVENFARISAARAKKSGEQAPEAGLVMGYYNAEELPVYDHLTSEYCVVDRWFSSVPGATWPNRLYATTGRAAGTRDDLPLPVYSLPSFVRHLDERGVDWRWYSFDPATLRMVDPKYRLSNHHRFAYVDSRKLSAQERVVGELLEEGPSFIDDAANGKLPAVSWIDPHFKDPGVLGPNSNDDHPPSDLRAGQDLVLRVFHALRSSPSWEKTLLVITYDEHGGFYDHVPPPPGVDDDPEFRRLGVRVPAILASPLVAAGSTSSALLGKDFHFDHTSIIKTILTRFCEVEGQIPAMTARVRAANHLGHLLLDGPPRDAPPNHAEVARQMTEWQQRWTKARYADPIQAGGDPARLTDFQTGFYDAARLLRRAGLPAGHP